MQNEAKGRLRRLVASLAVTLGMACATLAALEVVLRVCDFRELRQGASERSLGYRYDAEIGWTPAPNSTSVVTNARTVQVRHNGMGLREEEFAPGGRPVIMFLGDSFVWGLDAEAAERFTELLKPKLPDFRVLAADVSGYGTDQEYLLLRRLWPEVNPAVVVLVFCSDNDRLDNASNIRYEGYQKPYFVIGTDGQPVLQGPVPLSRQQYFNDHWLVRNLWLARIAVSVYLKLAHPVVFVPDPSERLVDMIRAFVESRGAKFLAIQGRDEALARYLQQSNIPFTPLEGAAAYPGAGVGGHWTPQGQAYVSERVFELLADNHIVAR